MTLKSPGPFRGPPSRASRRSVSRQSVHSVPGDPLVELMSHMVENSQQENLRHAQEAKEENLRREQETLRHEQEAKEETFRREQKILRRKQEAQEETKRREQEMERGEQEAREETKRREQAFELREKKCAA